MKMEQKKFDGRTASYKVSSVSALTSEVSDRYFGSLEDAKKYMESQRQMSEFRLGRDYYLQEKSGRSWKTIERMGHHFA